MQGVLSRATPAHACRCRACKHTINTLPRRYATTARTTPVTAARAARRKVTVSDVFTACYTTIMGTAAVLDARQKDRRREKLDRQIQEARAKLSTLIEQGAATAADIAEDIELDQAAARKAGVLPAYAPLGAGGAQPGALDGLSAILKWPSQLQSWDALLKRRRWYIKDTLDMFDLGQKPGTLVSVAQKVDLGALADAVAEEERQPGQHAREPLNTVHLEKTTDQVNRLVEDLLTEAHRFNGELTKDELLAFQRNPDAGWNVLRMLKSDGYPRYALPSNEQTTADLRRKLNETNLAVLVHWPIYRREVSVAKVCYNLLVSKVPPGIHTYNSLIIGFHFVGEHGLAQIVADFLLRNPLRPTQMTMVCLLHHYRITNDVLGFFRLVRRLIGHDPRGLWLGRRSVSDVARWPILRQWAANSDVNQYDGYFIQRAEIDSSVLDALLHGLLHFRLLQQAATAVAICWRDGCEVVLSTLQMMMELCIANFDRIAARTILQKLIHNVDDVVEVVLDESDRLPTFAYHIRYLFELCDAAIAPGEPKPSDPANYEPSVAASIRRLQTAAWVAQTTWIVRRLSVQLRKMETLLSRKAVPLNLRINHVSNVAHRFDSFVKGKANALARFRAAARYDFITEQVYLARKQADAVTVEVLEAILPAAGAELVSPIIHQQFELAPEMRRELWARLLATDLASQASLLEVMVDWSFAYVVATGSSLRSFLSWMEDHAEIPTPEESQQNVETARPAPEPKSDRLERIQQRVRKSGESLDLFTARALS